MGAEPQLIQPHVIQPSLILGPMLRHVDSTSATVWMETSAPCSVEVLGTTTRTFTVAGHHFALVIVEGLEPGTVTPYDVALEGTVQWPVADAAFPSSCIRTHASDQAAAHIVLGSCRTAAPHTPPWALELSLDERGRGVDALYALALQMRDRPPEEWPDLAVFLGDQVYADDSSPVTRRRIEERRESPEGRGRPETTLPPTHVDGFEEFTWLYQESWSPEAERWFFANVPSVMIFDDHEMIDDWNISANWVRDIRAEPWWQDHVIGGLMTYWLYQHLGNLSPAVIREEGLLASLQEVDDGEALLRRWAMESEEFTPVAGGYRFNFVRDVGRVRLVMIDARNGRVLEPGKRQMVDDDEWRWVTDACSADVDHLLIGSSLPVFVPGGMHDLQVWSEVVCDRRFGRRIGEWLRIKADMEDWPAFAGSFEAMTALLAEVGGRHRTGAPSTISVLSGDIHFSYAAQIHFPSGRPMASTVHQLVNSPIRNALTGPERTAMRLAMSRFAAVLGRVLRRSVGRHRPSVRWTIDHGPVFDNAIGQLRFGGREASLEILRTMPYEESTPAGFEVPVRVDLVAGAGAADLTR